jgi:hypothetical protein
MPEPLDSIESVCKAEPGAMPAPSEEVSPFCTLLLSGAGCAQPFAELSDILSTSNPVSTYKAFFFIRFFPDS